MSTSDALPIVPGCSDLVEVGRGGFAVVYRARQQSFDRDVAVKVINRNALGPETTSRFVRECRAIGALSWHPNVVTVYDAGTTEAGEGYLVMAWLEAGTLADELDEGPLPARRVVEVGVALAGALEATHQAGRLHRDVKPENVLTGPMGEPQLADFGIAAVSGQTITTDGGTMFSPAHVPPEVVGGADPTPASDIYSLASTLYALLAGRAPFERDSETSLLPLMARIAFDPPADLRPGVPDPIWEVVAAGLAKDPADRPRSAAAFAESLRRAGQALGWEVPPPVTGAGRRTSSRATVAGAALPPLTDRPAAPPAAPEAAALGSPKRSVRRAAQLGVGVLLVAAAAALALGFAGSDDGRSRAGSTTTTSAASAEPSGPGGDPEALLRRGLPGYQLRPGSQDLRDQAALGAQRIDPDEQTIVATATSQVLQGETPVAVAIVYGLSAEAANALVVEDRIVGSALDPGAVRAEGAPPTWRGQVTGTDGQVTGAAVLLFDDVALVLLGSDDAALDALISVWRTP